MRVCWEFLKSPRGYREFRTEGVSIDDGLDCDGVLVWADRVFASDADADGLDDGAITVGERPDTEGNAFLDFKLESLSPAPPPFVDLDLSPSSLGDEGIAFLSLVSSPAGVKYDLKARIARLPRNARDGGNAVLLAPKRK